MQAPAWLERGTERRALHFGMNLRSGDRIVTGPRARVVLRLEEGSHVKLGANAQLSLDSLQVPVDDSGVFSGALDILKGAFRFTTTLVNRKRNITAQLRSATIGIRGTDVWGKAEDGRDFVVLLEGQISIERNGAETILDTPMSLFMAPRDQPALPVAPVDPDDLGRWAQETEPQAGQGVINEGGEYRANLASYRDEAGAARLAERLGAAGYRTTAARVEVNGQSWWRVMVTNLATRADAESVSRQISSVVPLSSAWVERRP